MVHLQVVVNISLGDILVTALTCTLYPSLTWLRVRRRSLIRGVLSDSKRRVLDVVLLDMECYCVCVAALEAAPRARHAVCHYRCVRENSGR
jgi:hypothetical protein